MASRYGREIGLLRSLAQGMEIRPAMPSQQITQEFLRREQISLARPDGERLIVIRRSAGDAFTDLSECLVKRSPAMERGTIFTNVRTELLRTIATYAGRDPSSIGDEDIASLYAHFDGWFGELAARRRVFVPCVISPWAAPRFAIGPVVFVHIDEAGRSEFYPPVEDMLGRDGFDRMLALMRDNRANWLACVSVEGCEHQRAEEIGALAADLAIVALQLAVPLAWGTRTMGRLDARRGAAERRTLSEAGGYYNAGWSKTEAGLSIGTGTLADILQKTAPTIAAAGRCVELFASGQFRFPNLERAWCDAAYWLHEALVEAIDAIAIAKLETALEVLLRAESSSGSQTRMEVILATFYGLNPDDTVTSETTTTAKQFARGIVGDRSRILHGTWSTLNSRLALSRGGMEEFAIAVVRRAALELEAYANTTTSKDDIGAFLSWVKGRSEPATA